MELDIYSLDVRRLLNCAGVAFDILSGKLDSAFLRSQFVLKQNRENARHVETFVVPCCRTNYGKFEPVTLMVRILNYVVRRISFVISVFPDGALNFGRQRFVELVLNCVVADKFDF